jgi:4-phospho-D-threonate 3-dehydrogenase / 4-phospho-D-erythronate 3-dehydrogenase
MSPHGKPRIATIIGDPTGVGPEVTVRALATGKPARVSRPLLIGNIEALEAAAAVCDVHLTFKAVGAPSGADDVSADVVPVYDPDNLRVDEYEVGQISAAAGRASFEWLTQTIAFAENGEIDGFIMAPFESKALAAAGHSMEDAAFEPPGTYQLRINGPLRAAPLTEHIRLRDVSATVTRQNVVALILAIHEHLERWGLPRPRIAVAGLNPHSMYEEDAEEIAPAVSEAKSRGIDVMGPISPDAIFRMALEGKFDAVCSMYHDQGQIAVKTAAFVGACTVFLGLPYVRVGIPHGTAREIAGTGKAQHATMLAAMMTAAALANGSGFLTDFVRELV